MKSPVEFNAICKPAQTIHDYQKTLASRDRATTIATEAPTSKWGRFSKAARQGAAEGFATGASLTDKLRAGAASKNVALTPVASAIPGIAAGLVLPYAGNVATLGVSPLSQVAFGDGLPGNYSANKGFKAGAWNTFAALKEYGVAGMPELAFDAIAARSKTNWVKQGAATLSMLVGFVPGVARSATAIGSLVLFNVAPAIVCAVLGGAYKVGALAISRQPAAVDKVKETLDDANKKVEENTSNDPAPLPAT